MTSALAQNETREVIVVDDRSDDMSATVDAARSADDGTQRLTIIPLSENKGPAHARNVGISASLSPWISILDSDDYMDPGRFDRMFKLAGASCDIIADDLYQVSEHDAGAERRTMRFTSDHPVHTLTLEDFLRGNIPDPARPRTELGFLKPLMRREFLERQGLAYAEDMRLGEDYQLYAEALTRGARFCMLPACGYVAVMRRGSLSDRHGRSDLEACLSGDRRLLRLASLSIEARKLVHLRMRSTERKIAWIDVMEAIKSGRLPRAAAIVLERPHCAAHIMTGLSRIAARRIGGAASDH